MDSEGNYTTTTTNGDDYNCPYPTDEPFSWEDIYSSTTHSSWGLYDTQCYQDCQQVWVEDPPPPDGSSSSGSVSSEAIAFDDAIKDSLTHNCMRALLDSIKGVQSGNIATIISKLADTIPNYNWTLKEGILPANINGQTSYSNGMATTVIDYSKLQNATDIAAIRTMIHEAVHAYLTIYYMNDKTNFNNDYPSQLQNFIATHNQNLNDNQHVVMVVSFVGSISAAIQQVAKNMGYTNIPTQVFDDLAWGGLTTTKAFQGLSTDDQDRILERLAAEQTNTIQGLETPQFKALKCQ